MTQSFSREILQLFFVATALMLRLGSLYDMQKNCLDNEKTTVLSSHVKKYRGKSSDCVHPSFALEKECDKK